MGGVEDDALSRLSVSLWISCMGGLCFCVKKNSLTLSLSRSLYLSPPSLEFKPSIRFETLSLSALLLESLLS